MLALACDFRVMNSDRGFLCTNELDIGAVPTPALGACRFPSRIYNFVFFRHSNRISSSIFLFFLQDFLLQTE